MAKLKQHIFQVKGGWPFPIDMLRYDDAHPLTESDKALIERLSTENAQSTEDIRNTHVVTLVSHHRPAEGRWSSFLWRVLP